MHAHCGAGTVVQSDAGVGIGIGMGWGGGGGGRKQKHKKASKNTQFSRKLRVVQFPRKYVLLGSFFKMYFRRRLLDRKPLAVKEDQGPF